MSADVKKAMVEVENIVRREFTKGFDPKNRNRHYYGGLLRVDAHSGNFGLGLERLHLPESLNVAVTTITKTVRFLIEGALRLFNQKAFIIEINKDAEYTRNPIGAMILKLQITVHNGVVNILCVGCKLPDYTPHAPIVIPPARKEYMGKPRGPKPKKKKTTEDVVQDVVQDAVQGDASVQNGHAPLEVEQEPDELIDFDALRALWGNEPALELCVQVLIEKGLLSKNTLLRAIGSNCPTRKRWRAFITELREHSGAVPGDVWDDFRRDLHWYLLKLKLLKPFEAVQQQSLVRA